VPLRFQPAPRAPEQRAGVRTRPGRSSQTHTGRPNRSYLFCSNQSQRARVTSYQREVSGQVTGRLSVPYQSSFGELRMGPRLRDTLDTGLCCSSQGRGQLSQVIYKLSQVIYKVMSTSIYNLPHRHFWVPFAVSQWFPFVQHIRQGKQDGYPTNLDRLTYFQTHGELHKGPCTFSLPGTNNLPRHLCTPAATSYLRFIMDAQRPWPHFVQLNGLPDQMPEVAKDRERLEVSLPSSKCFAEAHASSTWAVSSAPAGPAIVGFYHFLTPAVTPEDSTPGFSTPASPAEVDHGFLRIPGACYVAVDNRKAEAERDLDNGALVLRYLHMGHN